MSTVTPKAADKPIETPVGTPDVKLEEPIKVDNADAATATPTADPPVNPPVIQQNKQETPAKSADEGAKPETEPTSNVKHLVRYVGNGIWKDRRGIYWCREQGKHGCISEHTFSHAEYIGRTDIHFMVDHGIMKETTVE